MELGSQIRQQRIAHGLLQDDLAEAIFVSRQTISNWENGRTYPDAQSLLLLGQLFDVSINELIQGDAAVAQRMMKEDALRMRWLSVVMVVALVLAVAFFVGLATAWRDPLPWGNLTTGDVAGLAVFAPPYLLSLGSALWIERIKHRYDLVAACEVVAFAQGGVTPEEDAARDHRFARRHPIAATATRYVFAATAGAVVGLLIYKLIISA